MRGEGIIADIDNIMSEREKEYKDKERVSEKKGKKAHEGQ